MHFFQSKLSWSEEISSLMRTIYEISGLTPNFLSSGQSSCNVNYEQKEILITFLLNILTLILEYELMFFYVQLQTTLDLITLSVMRHK